MMYETAGAGFRSVHVFFYASVILSVPLDPCPSATASLSPPNDENGPWRGSDVWSSKSLGASIAEIVRALIPARRRGSTPLVGVVHGATGDDEALLQHLLSGLQRRMESSVLLLARTKGTDESSVLTPRYRMSVNMSHAIFIESSEVPFEGLFDVARQDPHWSPRTMHVVVALMTATTGANKGIEVSAIFNMTWRHWVANTMVLAPTVTKDEDSGGTFSVLSHFPYAGGEFCGNNSSRIEEVAVLRGNRSIKGDVKRIYPKDFSNLHGCTVKVTVFHRPPTCVLKGKGRREDEVAQLDGIHGRFLALASQRMNFSTEIVQFFPERYSINPYEEILLPLIRGVVVYDIILCGAALTPLRHSFFGEGVLNEWTCSTFSVPVSHPGGSWRLLSLATPTAWAALGASVAISCAASWAVEKLRPHRPSVRRSPSGAATDALSAFAGVSLPRPPKIQSQRALFPAICLAGLIATTAMKSHLSSFLSAPDDVSWAPSNLEELVESGMRVVGTVGLKFLAKDMWSESWKAVLERYELYNEETEELDFVGVAVAGMENNLRHRLINRSRERTVLKDCPLPLPTAVFLHKGSPFESEMRKLVRGLTSGGIYAKWNRDLTRNDRAATEAMKHKGRRKISVGELNGVFTFYAIGLLAGSLALALEIFIRIKLKRRN